MSSFRKKSRRARVIGLAGLLAFLAMWNVPAAHAQSSADDLITRHGVAAADARSDWLRVLLLRDYNTRIVLMGTVALGMSGGVVGVFMLLRKKALLGDVISHATLPGIALAFIVVDMWHPGSGKSLPVLLTGAAISGMAGVLCVSALRRWTRIKDDAALAVVLSVFFGIGIALFTIVQRLPGGNAAGLGHFIYGKAASMMAKDVWLIGGISLLVLALCILLYKELAIVAFDPRYAASMGWPVHWLDMGLMLLVVIVSVVGLQSVGLLLVVALLVVPPAAARFWTERLSHMVVISAAIGGCSAFGGVVTSALFPRISTGAIIALFGSFLFLLSLLFGTQRGVVRRIMLLRRARQRTGRQHLLRAFYEALAGDRGVTSVTELAARPVTFEQLLLQRRWSRRELHRLLHRAQNEGLVAEMAAGWGLTPVGAEAARQVVRNHRLWELYLIHFADIAPSHVDRDADDIEHVLDAEILHLLEERMGREYPGTPTSPHEVTAPVAGSDPRTRTESSSP